MSDTFLLGSLSIGDVDNILTIVGNTKVDDTFDIRPVPGVKTSF